MTTQQTATDAPAKAYRRVRAIGTAWAGWLDGQPHVAYVTEPRSRFLVAGPVVCQSRLEAVAKCQEMQSDLERGYKLSR